MNFTGYIVYDPTTDCYLSKRNKWSPHDNWTTTPRVFDNISAIKRWLTDSSIYSHHIEDMIIHYENDIKIFTGKLQVTSKYFHCKVISLPTREEVLDIEQYLLESAKKFATKKGKIYRPKIENFQYRLTVSVCLSPVFEKIDISAWLAERRSHASKIDTRVDKSMLSELACALIQLFHKRGR